MYNNSEVYFKFMMRLNAIVVVDNNWAIGSPKGLLYKLPLDLQQFKKTTSGHIIVMGINTLKTLPGARPLPNRVTICIDSTGTPRDDCHVVKSTQECLDLLKLMTAENEAVDVYICGGAFTYKSFLPYCDKLLINKVDASSAEATVFFPNIDDDEHFYISNVGPAIVDNGYTTRLYTYVRG